MSFPCVAKLTMQDNKLMIVPGRVKTMGVEYYHLYVTSNENINIGDYFYNHVCYKIQVLEEGVFSFYEDDKIIATTNSSLNLPQLSKENLEVYIETQGKCKVVKGCHGFLLVKNSKTPITDVLKAMSPEELKESWDKTEKVCRNCKYFEFKNMKKLFKPDHKRGICKSPKWAVNPEYYIDYEGELNSDMVEVTYQPNVGEDFGCKHFKYK